MRFGLVFFAQTRVELEPNDSLVWMLAQTFFALLAVCGLIYFLSRWMIPKLVSGGFGNRIVRIVDSTTVEPRRRLYVIEVAGKCFLVASSNAGLQMLSELDAASVELSVAEARELSKTRIENIRTATRNTLRRWPKMLSLRKG